MAILKYKDVNGNWRILLGGGASSNDITVDSVLSTVSENPVLNKVITNAVVEISDYVDDIKAGYLKSANLDSNTLTLVNQDDEEIKFLSNPADIVSTTEDGLVPKIENFNNDSISSPMDDWVLTSNKGSTPTWKRLPSIGDTSEFIQGFHHTTGTASGTRNINADNDPTVQDRSTNPNRYYGVETDSEGKLFVNVPWERGEAGVSVEYGAGTGLSLESNIFNHTNAIDKNEEYPTGNLASADGGIITVRDIKYDAQGHVTGYQDRNILLSQTTYTFANGENGFTVTPSGGSAQTVTVTPKITNNVTYTGNLTSGKIAVFDGTAGLIKASEYSINLFTNAIPTTFTWTAGNAEGPTGSLTGTDMSPVLFGAIPSASASSSGIVTTGDQTFAGIKTFNSDIKINSSKKTYFNYSSTYTENSNYVAGSSTTNLILNGYSTITFAIAGALKCKLTSSALHPQTSGDITLGTSSYKFGNVYAASIGTSDYRCTYGYFSESVYAASGFYESSDERLKHILNPVKVNLDQLSKLRKVYFLWKEKPENGKQLGVIAQDVQKLYPELVSSDSKTGLLSVAYDKLSIIALEAVDILYQEHVRLKERVDKLEKLLTNKGIL